MSLVRNISGIEQVGTNYVYSGKVVNSVTGEPIPFATVQISAPIALPIQQTIADANGFFSITSPIADGQIWITAAEYKEMIFPASQYQTVFELEPKDNTLPDVIVTSDGSKPFPWWILLATVPFIIKKKKKVGKIDTGSVVAISAGLLFLKGFGLFNSLLEGLGLQDSTETKALDASATNPLSPWSPNFWKSGPAGTIGLTVSTMENMTASLIAAFDVFNDNEAAAAAVFKSLKTQSQLSFYADWFQQNTGNDLLSWLRGSGWPADRLSDKEVYDINQFILNLPKYIP